MCGHYSTVCELALHGLCNGLDQFSVLTRKKKSGQLLSLLFFIRSNFSKIPKTHQVVEAGDSLVLETNRNNMDYCCYGKGLGYAYKNKKYSKK